MTAKMKARGVLWDTWLDAGIRPTAIGIFSDDRYAQDLKAALLVEFSERGAEPDEETFKFEKYEKTERYMGHPVIHQEFYASMKGWAK